MWLAPLVSICITFESLLEKGALQLAGKITDWSTPWELEIKILKGGEHFILNYKANTTSPAPAFAVLATKTGYHGLLSECQCPKK